MFAVFHFYKKRVAAAIMVLVLAAGAIILFNLPQSNAAATPITIAIDPGHGGYDGGVSGLQTGAKESDINLSIALYARAYLQNVGYKVVLTRDRDRAPVEAGSVKRRDMYMRLAVINGAAADLAVSIHCNFYPSRYRRGIQVFYNKDADMPLAATMQSHLNDALNQSHIGRGFSPLWGDYYLLAQVPCPAVIVECGFLSNAEDEALLTDENYRMTLAYEICRAIEKTVAATA